MVTIRWTREAERWLQHIHTVISAGNPATADQRVMSLYQKAQILGSYPQTGALYRFDTDGEIRILLHGHYRIVYLFKTNQTVDLLGVFEGNWDPDRNML